METTADFSSGDKGCWCVPGALRGGEGWRCQQDEHGVFFKTVERQHIYMLTRVAQWKEKNHCTGRRREISYGGTENREIEMRSRNLSTGVSSGLQASGGSTGLFTPGPGHRKRPLEMMTALQQWQGLALLGVRAVPVRTLPGA